MTSYATRLLLRETIIDELQVLPELLWKAEKLYIAALSRVAEMKERLLTPADIRQAESEADRLKLEVDYLRRKLDNYRVMAQLLLENIDAFDRINRSAANT